MFREDGPAAPVVPHVVATETTQNISGTGVAQPNIGPETNRPSRAEEVGGLMVHPAAREFGIASLLVKVMMALRHSRESGRDAPDEQYLAHVVDGKAVPIHALLEGRASRPPDMN